MKSRSASRTAMTIRTVCVAIALAPGLAAVGAPKYSIKAFGLRPLRPTGAAVNDQGQRLLYLDSSYSLELPPIVLYGIHNTIPLSFGPSTAAQNNQGVILGTMPIDGGGVDLIRWSMSERQQIATVTAPFAVAALNDVEEFAGVSSDGITARSYFGSTTSGIITDIGTLGGVTTYASDMNNRGQVVGFSKTGTTPVEIANGSAVDEAFLFENGQIRGLGTIAGIFSFARAINDLGQVVGESSTDEFINSGQVVTHAFLYSPELGMQDIGRPGLISIGLDINNRSEVVGREIAQDGTFHAFIYNDIDGMQYLEQLIPQNSDWGSLSQATSINNRGQIVGTGIYKGNVRAFLLTPIPEPATIILAVVSILWLAVGSGSSNLRRAGGTGGLTQGATGILPVRSGFTASLSVDPGPSRRRGEA